MPRNSQPHSSEREMHGTQPGHSDATAMPARREAIRNPVLGRSPSDPFNAPFTGRTLNSADYKAALMATQIENNELREEAQDLRRKVFELQQSLEDLELESEPPSAPRKRSMVDGLRSALRKHATLYDPFPPKDKEFYQQACPEDSGILTDYNKRYKDEESESLANIAEFHATLPHDHILQLIDGDLVLVRQIVDEARKIRCWMLNRAREVADYIFNLPSSYFSANRNDSHPPELQKLFSFTPSESASFSKLAPILYPPEFRLYAKPPVHQLFKSPEIAKLIKAALFGPESLKYDRNYPKPETMGRLWGIGSSDDLPISAIAIFSSVAVFLVSNDPQFTSDSEKTRSGIDYPKLIRSYKKLILKFQTSNPTRFDELIQFYDNIIFDAGIKKTLGKDGEKPQEKSSGSEIDFKTDSETEDWYIGRSDPEAQPPTTSESGILVPPVLSTVQPTATMPASAASQQAQQSLGLGLPQAIRQSDSLRRRVTPIPSIHFIPSLDHNSGLSNELETLASRNPATPTDQPQQPAAAADDDEPPAPADESQAPAPSGSKRGKTRGSKTSKASGSRGRGKQRAN